MSSTTCRFLNYPGNEFILFQLFQSTQGDCVYFNDFFEFRKNNARAYDIAAFNRKEFERELTRVYQSLVNAWRLLLDERNEGLVGLNQFFKVCTAVGFKGNPKALWDEYKNNRGY